MPVCTLSSCTFGFWQHDTRLSWFGLAHAAFKGAAAWNDRDVVTWDLNATQRVLADWMVQHCARSCKVCFPTLPLTQLWDAPDAYFWGSSGNGFQAQLPTEDSFKATLGNYSVFSAEQRSVRMHVPDRDKVLCFANMSAPACLELLSCCTVP